ncbi:MAG: GlsB/YeaQ/YmgE family stress response membrane protein [Candidatus Woesebacteria bacterium]
MSFLYWIVFGLIAGSIANFLSPSSMGGIVGSIVLGIIGAIVGGYLGQHFFGVGVTGFNMMSFAVAVAGSLLVLFVSRLL